MKIISLIAFTALVSSTQSVMIQKEASGLPEENNFFEVEDDGLLMCKSTKKTHWKHDLDGFYEDSDVKELDGEESLKTLNNKHHFGKNPIFVVAYHPQCPHCKTMVDDYKQLATDFKDAKVTIAAINMSKAHKEQSELDVYEFPTVRFYTKAGHFEKFHGHHRNYKGFKDFLTSKGIEI